MVEHAPRPGTAPRVGWWVAAALAVPLLLAGVGQLWVAPGVGEDLRQRAEAALAAAGLGGVAVTMDGRDAELGGVPGGAQAGAVAAVAAVPGVRDVTVDARSTAPPVPMPTTASPTGTGLLPVGPPVTAPSGVLPTSPAADGGLAPAARAALAERLAAAVAAVPITFAPDSAELVGAAAGTAREVARLLAAEPAARVSVEGHVADTPGAPDVAQRLSERRAAVVAEALVAGGVERGRITTTGRAAEQPLATPEASRRVEISIG